MPHTPEDRFSEILDLHGHPLDLSRVIYGRRLNPGEMIKPGDVYDSTSGKWEKAPCPGMAVPEGFHVVWVRPEQTIK